MGVSGRSLTVYAGLVVTVAIVVTWRHAEAVFSPSRAALPELGRPYAVDLSGRQPAIDLEFDADSRYELIVSSLGDGLQACAVRLEAQFRRCVESFPALPFEPLAPRTVGAPATWDTAKAATSHELGAAERRLFLHVTAGRLDDEWGYIPVTGRLAGEGQRVRVYVDRQTSPGDLAPELVDEMIRLFDLEIIPRSREIVGEHADVDGDGKLAILVTPWLGKLGGGATSLNGMVRSSDFQRIEAPFGNHADVIYVNSALRPGLALKTLLAHEYTHAVCFSRRLVADAEATTLPVEEDWLNESIAHVAEKLHGGDWSNLDRRIAAFLAAPQSAPLVVRDYYRAGLWRDPGCRGATFLFLQFCVNRFGEQLLRDLVSAPFTGKGNLESATRMRFAELMRHWALALSEESSASLPLCGKLGDCSLTGISRIPWAVEGGPCEFEVHGTATAFIDLTDGRRKGVVRVTIHAAPAARLQLTVVRRPR